ncbi:hypothetical protein PWT90_00993 [Aphanocladium album]|nr:hypothetical protein PWT90_00993 [Aphanocladium album]
MTSDNENPPPSYSEATAQGSSGSPHDGARPDGWVEGYVEAPSAQHQTAVSSSYQPPAPVDDKSALRSESTEDTAAVPSQAAADTSKPAGAEESKPKPSSGISFGGIGIGGGKVVGVGYGDTISGSGIKFGPLMLGMIDTNARSSKEQEKNDDDDDEQATATAKQ